MTWTKIDDQFYDHPKVVAAGPLGIALFVCGLSYCSRHLTDGFISVVQVRRLIDIDNPGDVAERLVSVGLWERRDGGYQVHDYLEYNPSRAKVKAIRQARAEAGHTGGLRSGEARRKQAEEEAEAKMKQTSSKTEAKAKAKTNSRSRSRSRSESPSHSQGNAPSAGADAPSTPPLSKAPQSKPKKPKRDPLTAGQRGFLDLFGAKRFKTIAQRDAVLVIEREHGTEKLLTVARWAAENGMSVGKAIGSVRTALPNWDKPKKSKTVDTEPHSGIRQWLTEQGIEAQ